MDGDDAERLLESVERERPKLEILERASRLAEREIADLNEQLSRSRAVDALLDAFEASAASFDLTPGLEAAMIAHQRGLPEISVTALTNAFAGPPELTAPPPDAHAGCRSDLADSLDRNAELEAENRSLRRELNLIITFGYLVDLELDEDDLDEMRN